MTYEQILERRAVLKEMLKAAQAIPANEVTAKVVEKIKVELLFLKLELNCSYQVHTPSVIKPFSASAGESVTEAARGALRHFDVFGQDEADECLQVKK